MYLLRALFFCGTIVTFSGSAFSQVGKETTYWNWTEPSDIHKGMVRVRSIQSGGMVATGSGAVIEGMKILTAAHVVDRGLTFEVVYFDGSTATATLARLNSEQDIAVLKVEKVANGVAVLKVAEKAPEDGSFVEVCGFGGGGGLRHFSGHVGVYSGDVLGVDACVIPGDSGGAVLNESGEVIGVVSGGMCWSLSKQAVSDGVHFRATWPVRCAGLEAIQKALK